MTLEATLDTELRLAIESVFGKGEVWSQEGVVTGRRNRITGGSVLAFTSDDGNRHRTFLSDSDTVVGQRVRVHFCDGDDVLFSNLETGKERFRAPRQWALRLVMLALIIAIVFAAGTVPFFGDLSLEARAGGLGASSAAAFMLWIYAREREWFLQLLIARRASEREHARRQGSLATSPAKTQANTSTDGVSA